MIKITHTHVTHDCERTTDYNADMRTPISTVRADIIMNGNAVNPKANLSAICNALAAAINIAPLVAQDYNVSRNGRRCAFGYSEPRFAAASAPPASALRTTSRCPWTAG